ncbi:MAG: PilZ domain-containing protein [Candidatus Omnitrophota bacterium]
MQEKRKSRRYKAKLLIATVYSDDSGRIVTEESIFTHDISLEGLRLSYPSQLPKGRILDLKIFLFNDPIHLPARGKVAWSNKKKTLEVAVSNKKNDSAEELYWAGIQFIDVDAFTRERILSWIRKEFDVVEE